MSKQPPASIHVSTTSSLLSTLCLQSYLSLASLKPLRGFLVLRLLPASLAVSLHALCAARSLTTQSLASSTTHVFSPLPDMLFTALLPWKIPNYHSDLNSGFTFLVRLSLTLNSKLGIPSRKSGRLSTIAFAKCTTISLLLVYFLYCTIPIVSAITICSPQQVL